MRDAVFNLVLCTENVFPSMWVSIRTIGGVPKKIATYLGLQEPELYTGMCTDTMSQTPTRNS
jgi:hypothetical protein